MKSIQIEFSKYESVNFLWSELIEHYGFERAKKIVSQAIDLQKMNGNKNSDYTNYIFRDWRFSINSYSIIKRRTFKKVISKKIKYLYLILKRNHFKF